VLDRIPGDDAPEMGTDGSETVQVTVVVTIDGEFRCAAPDDGFLAAVTVHAFPPTESNRSERGAKNWSAIRP
jgi:hypothetical protein